MNSNNSPIQTAPVFQQQTTSINMGQTAPVPVNTGYFDKPADKRLRPWVLLGSLILTLMGIGMIITSNVHWGHAHSLWGVLAAGIALTIAGLVGLVASFTLRPAFSGLFFFTILAAWLASLAVLIVNAVFLNSNAIGQCDYNGAPRFSSTCEGIRQYHYIIFSIFGVLTAVWVPTLVLAAGYLWRTTSIYRKQEYGANNTPMNTLPTGVSRM